MAFKESRMTGEQRAELDEKMRGPLREALASGYAGIEDVVYLLTRVLAEMTDQGNATGHLMAAFEQAAKRSAMS